MKRNELFIRYPWPTEENGYYIRTYESLAEFTHRDFFEHRHADFEISCVLRGKGLYRLQKRSETPESGDVFVFGSNQVHCITDSDPADPLLLFNIQFEPRMLWSPSIGLSRRAYLPLFNGKCERLDRGSELSRIVRSKIAELRAEGLAQSPGYDLMIRALLDEILTVLMRHAPLPADDRRDDRRETLLGMDRAMTYIDAHLNEPLTLGEIAAYCGFSRTYFSTLFSALNGLTPWEYITIRRIEHSKRLLRTTQLPVLTVAGMCGYENLSNFNRMFVRTEGMPPSAYRKAHTS